MKIGDFIDKTAFKREKNRLIVDNVCAIDFIRNGNTIEVHEVKKGKSGNEAQKMQVLFYMYVFTRLLHEEVRGFIHYPQAKKVIEISPDHDKIRDAIENVKRIINEECPKPIRIPICHGCSYAEMCWS
jgi:CRISPR-associated exonuclease Cas4